jgi:hypothetical protein
MVYRDSETSLEDVKGELINGESKRMKERAAKLVRPPPILNPAEQDG